MGLKDNVDFSIRSYLSTSHIQTAEHFASQARIVEEEYAKTNDSELTNVHRAHVTGAVFFAVAFLEATINELFCDAFDGNVSNLKGLDADSISIMSKMWGRGVPRTAKYTILVKFDIALELARKPAFDNGALPYQAVNNLVKLRNALVHFEPETVRLNIASAQGSVKPPKIEEELRGKFATNPLTSAGNPFFPDKCLSYGCAKWAVESSRAYADEFFQRFGVPPHV